MSILLDTMWSKNGFFILKNEMVKLTMFSIFVLINLVSPCLNLHVEFIGYHEVRKLLLQRMHAWVGDRTIEECLRIEVERMWELKLEMPPTPAHPHTNKKNLSSPYDDDDDDDEDDDDDDDDDDADDDDDDNDGLNQRCDSGGNKWLTLLGWWWWVPAWLT